MEGCGQIKTVASKQYKNGAQPKSLMSRKQLKTTTMKKSKSIILFLAGLLSSCCSPHYYYIPNVQNVPLFKEKNEYRASVEVGVGSYFSNKEVQAAYSITDKIAIMANFMSFKNVNNGNVANGKYFDAAVGYYKPLGKSGVFEVYGGFGTGNLHDQYNPYNVYDTTGLILQSYNQISSLSFTKIFLQPSIGLTFKGFDIALSTRICGLYFNKINNQIIDNHQPNSDCNQNDFERVNMLAHNKNWYFIEPALTIRGGWKYVKAQLQAGISTINLYRPNQYGGLFDPFNFNMGLYITIAKRYGKKFQKK